MAIAKYLTEFIGTFFPHKKEFADIDTLEFSVKIRSGNLVILENVLKRKFKIREPYLEADGVKKRAMNN